jgi:hypothetical protein
VQALQPTNTRRLTIGPPPQLDKRAHPRKVFADRLLCRSFTFLKGGSCVASRPRFLGLMPSGTQNPSSRCFPRLGSSAAYCATRWFRARSPGKLTETRSGLWHNRVGKVHDSSRPAERDDRREGSAT